MTNTAGLDEVFPNNAQPHALMGRISHDRGHHPWASRDYAEPIRCRCVSCLFHDQVCDHLCGMPSKSVINGAGQCEGYIESKQIKPVSI